MVRIDFAWPGPTAPARPGHLRQPRLLPGGPREGVGFRIQVTAANTDAQVSELLAARDRLADVVPLRQV